jgi:hypothetical protein
MRLLPFLRLDVQTTDAEKGESKSEEKKIKSNQKADLKTDGDTATMGTESFK